MANSSCVVPLLTVAAEVIVLHTAYFPVRWMTLMKASGVTPPGETGSAKQQRGSRYSAISSPIKFNIVMQRAQFYLDLFETIIHTKL